MSLDDELKSLFVFMNIVSVITVGFGLLFFFKITVVILLVLFVVAIGLTIYDVIKFR